MLEHRGGQGQELIVKDKPEDKSGGSEWDTVSVAEEPLGNADVLVSCPRVDGQAKEGTLCAGFPSKTDSRKKTGSGIS